MSKPKRKPAVTDNCQLTTDNSFPHIAAGLRPLATPIGDLKPDPRNARKHGDDSLAGIKLSLEKFGQRKPIVANRANGQIEAGHGTLAAATALGWSHVAVVWVEDNATAQRGFALADNRTAELSDWDEALLDELLDETQQETPDLYDALLFDELRQEAEEDEPDSEAAGEPVPDQFSVIIDCRDEEDQKALFEQLKAEGRECRLLTL